MLIPMIVITSIFAVALTLFVLSVRTKHRTIVCPIHGTEVRVRFLESFPRRRPLEVTACSAFRPPDAVICRQRCLPLLARPAAPQADSVAHRQELL
jgi:hypothetical protein